MKNFELSSFVKIKGIGAASGLLYDDQIITLISDDSDVLYRYDLSTETFSKTSLRPDGKFLESIPKPEKSDFESITEHNGTIYIFGSGSSPKRNKLIKTKAGNEEVLQELSLTDFYDKLKSTAAISDEDFNIEGAIVRDHRLLLFNRGNGPNGKNGVFEILYWEDENDQQIRFYPISLPEIQNVPFGFTDAIQLDDKIYFIGSAESGGSTYHDGDVLGSMIGILDAYTLELKTTQIITSEHKIEGIALYCNDENGLSFLLCEDSDDGGEETEVFFVRIINNMVA